MAPHLQPSLDLKQAAQDIFIAPPCSPLSCAALGTSSTPKHYVVNPLAAKPKPEAPRRRHGPKQQATSFPSRLQLAQQQQQGLEYGTMLGFQADEDDGVRTPKDLTNAIHGTQTRQQLHRTCMLHRSHMNFIHAAAAITKLAKLDSALQHDSAPLPQQQQQRPYPTNDYQCITDVAYLVAMHCTEFQPRALANALWASSKLAVQLQTQQGNEQQHLTQQGERKQLISLYDSTVATTRPPHFQHASALAPATQETAITAVLDLAACLCAHVPKLASGFEPQHCANVLYALASFKQVHDAQQDKQGQITKEQQAEVDEGELLQAQGATQPQSGQLQLKKIMAQAPLVLQATSPGNLAGMSPQGLANTLYAVAKLGLNPEEAWMDVWLDVAQAQIPLFEPQHISNAMWALAKLGFFPGDDWLGAALQVSMLKLPAFTPQGLALLLWSLVVLQARPPPPLLTALLERAHSFGPQDMSSVLWALAKLQVISTQQTLASQQQQPEQAQIDRLSAAVVRQVVVVSVDNPQAKLIPSSPQDLSISVWAMSCLHPLLLLPPSHPSQRSLLRPSLISPPTTSSTSSSTSALVCVWLGWAVQASLPLLPRFSSQELSNFLLGLARLSHYPTLISANALTLHWWARVAHASCSCLPGAEVQHVVNILWAAAVLGHKPGAQWARALCRKVLAEQHALTGQGLALVLWSLARLKLQPGRRWLHTLLAPHSRIRKHKPPHAPALHRLNSKQAGVGKGVGEGALAAAAAAAEIGDNGGGGDIGDELEASADVSRVWEGANLRVLAMSLWALPRLGLMAKPRPSSQRLLRARFRSGSPVQVVQGPQQQQQQERRSQALTPLQIQQQLRLQQEQENRDKQVAMQQEASLIYDRLQNDAGLLRPLLAALHAQLVAALQQVDLQRWQTRQQQVVWQRATSSSLQTAAVGEQQQAAAAFASSSMSASIMPALILHTSDHATGTMPVHATATMGLSEVAHALSVAVRALGRLNHHGHVSPLLSRPLTRTLDDACILCAPRFGGVALSAVMGGLARLGHCPSPTLCTVLTRRASMLIPSSSDQSAEAGAGSNSQPTEEAGGSTSRSSRRAWGDAVQAGDYLSPWQLTVVLYSMAALKCPVSKQWVLSKLYAWRAMRRGSKEGAADGDWGTLEDENTVNNDGLLFEGLSESVGEGVGKSENKKDSFKREFAALLHVAKVYNVPMPD